LILGFLAAIHLGRREYFRRQLTLAIGLCGIAVAVYALGFAWRGWPALPWAMIDGGTERLNVCFAHYSGPPACLNLAWPLLVFGVTGRLAGMRRIVPVLIVGAALPLWNSATGKAIAVGLLVAGTIWHWGAKQGWLAPRRVCAALGTVLVAVFACQWFAIAYMQKHTPDNWISADDTLIHANTTDARLRELAGQRADRLVPSRMADRPSGWLCALRMAADYPLIGLGPGAWVKRSALYTQNSVVHTFYHYRQYAHHDLLQFAAEWGGLATLATLYLWLGGFWRAIHRNSADHSAEAGIMLALFGIALHSTVDFPLQNPALQLWTALLLGLAWSGTRAK
jgi:hypothetical protein